MINKTTKKWKSKVEQLEKDLAYEKRLKDGAREELHVSQGKVEVYEERDRESRSKVLHREKELESQVLWLRRLVEKLVVSPEVIAAETHRGSVMQKQDRKDREQEFNLDQKARIHGGRFDRPMIKKPKEFLFGIDLGIEV